MFSLLTYLQTQLYLFFFGPRKYPLIYESTNHFLILHRVEENVLIACACIPTLGPLFKLMQGKDFKSAFRAISQYWRRTNGSDHIALNEYDSLSKVKDSSDKFQDAGRDMDNLQRDPYHFAKISAV